jgi:hypothetical protein
MTDRQAPDPTGAARCPRGGWAARWENLTPEDFPDDRHVWKRYRLRAGLKQATVIRRMLDLAAANGVVVAQRATGKCHPQSSTQDRGGR